jgi:hypothetical protein
MVAVAALTTATAAALSVASFWGVDLASPAAAATRNFLDEIRDRSPGARTDAQLTKTKHRSSQVLAEREALAAILPTLYAPPLEAFTAPPLTSGAVLAPPEVSMPAPLPAKLGGPGTPFSFAPPGGGGGPSGPPQQPPASVPQQPQAALEPGTWMMLILGFGLIGWILRRARVADALKA